MGQPGMNLNNFGGDLQFSHGFEPFWGAIYKEAFPTLSGHMPIEDLSFQRMGIDRVLSLSDGGLIYVEEKLRREVYPDILLEYVSDTVHKTPGWIEKDLKCNYLSYAFLPIQKCYLFPWLKLRDTWATFKQLFLRNYRIVEAHNPSYSTLSVAIPITILQTLVPRSIEVRLN